MSGSKEINSYRQIMKATSIFGGVQVITILIGIIKTKFIAIWLGATGIGIIGMLNTPLTFIATLSGLGLSSSAVREIAEASGTGNKLHIARVIKTFRRWIWFTGIMGMIITIILAPLLSKWSFGNSDYTWAFIFLSLTLLLNDIGNGQKVLLQGLRRLKDMAQSTIIGTVIGLFTSLPLFYFYGTEGIVPSILITTVSSLVISWYYSNKIKTQKIHLPYLSSYKEGKTMVKLGIVLTVSGLIGTLIRYLIATYISNEGGLEQVGLYQVGITFITGYVGIVFTAMSTDYFPRLASTKNNNDCTQLINQQIEIALLVITPICIALLIALPIVVRLLYSATFNTAIPMLEWFLVAVIVKAAAWAIGYMFLAKADYSLAFKVDSITNVFLLVGYIGLFERFRLEGIGVAELILHCFSFILVFLFTQKKYCFTLYRNTIIVIFSSISISLLIFFILRVFERNYISYIFSITLWTIISFMSLKSLDRRLGLKHLIVKFIKR